MNEHSLNLEESKGDYFLSSYIYIVFVRKLRWRMFEEILSPTKDERTQDVYLSIQSKSVQTYLTEKWLLIE